MCDNKEVRAADAALAMRWEIVVWCVLLQQNRETDEIQGTGGWFFFALT
jgi:hypothetical protein